MQKKYVVRLTDTEREALSVLVKKKRVSSQKVLRARVGAAPERVRQLDPAAAGRTSRRAGDRRLREP